MRDESFQYFIELFLRFFLLGMGVIIYNTDSPEAHCIKQTVLELTESLWPLASGLLNPSSEFKACITMAGTYHF